jgi:hemerythrin-like domain-containing protein
MSDAPFQNSAATRAIALIKDEHRTLARMLGAIQLMVAHYCQNRTERDFELFDAMLRYIENVPNLLHHPKEDQVLFPPFLRFTAGEKQLVCELELEHETGARRHASLRRAFHAFRTGVINGPILLTAAAGEFADFYRVHMQKEETRLLPLAVARLTVGEWQRIESAFGDKSDPLFGADIADDYQQLYQCIIELSPASLRLHFESAVTP